MPEARWRIRFDVSASFWVPSSQNCQRLWHDACVIRACGCVCHLDDPFEQYITNPFGYWEEGDYP